MNQSVSMLGYQKHMQNHIDVIFHVLDYINAYKEKADYDKLKELYMARRIAGNGAWTGRCVYKLWFWR